MQELWTQFRKETTAGYRLYAKGLERPADDVPTGRRRWGERARAIAWAILDKLTPARRVLLLVALACSVVGRVEFTRHDYSLDLRGAAILLLLLLLVLELADRVTMKRDMQIAREIQRWLLPHEPPRLRRAEIAFATIPANTVAGDYFDVFVRRPSPVADADPCLLIAIADVAGKSVPAALLMATLQSSLRTVAYEDVALPELVSRVNRYACDHSLDGRRFTTAVIAELEPASGVLRYVNAGHNAPVVRRADGSMVTLEAGGIPLGIKLGAPHQAREIRLAPGDVLVMYTDGVVEAEDEGKREYGEPRLLELIRTMPAGTAAQAIDRIVGSVESFISAAPQTDDLTCFVVRYTG